MNPKSLKLPEAW